MCPRLSNMAYFCMTSGEKQCFNKLRLFRKSWSALLSGCHIDLVLGKVKDCKICTVFELHLYEHLKCSLTQIRNKFEILDIGSQQKGTKNREKNIWNYAANNDVLEFCAISLINTLRKRGIFPSGHEVKKMKNERLRNFKHKIADLYIFGNGELVDLIFWILITSSLQKPPNLYLTTQKK